MILPAQSSVEDQPKMSVLVHIFYNFTIKVQRGVSDFFVRKHY